MLEIEGKKEMENLIWIGFPPQTWNRRDNLVPNLRSCSGNFARKNIYLSSQNIQHDARPAATDVTDFYFFWNARTRSAKRLRKKPAWMTNQVLSLTSGATALWSLFFASVFLNKVKWIRNLRFHSHTYHVELISSTLEHIMEYNRWTWTKICIPMRVCIS